jgi:cell wall-associated NlpC family hydrolase
MSYRILGPKGNPIVRSAPAARVKAILPALKRRFAPGRITVLDNTPAPVSLRDKVVELARKGVANEPKIHYAETRPMPLAWKLPLTTDCSGFATLCYKLAGAPDPNGLSYNGTGYTGTLIGRGKPVRRPQPGDLVFYGPGAAFHVAIVVEAGPDPLTVSHGQEAGPQYCRVSQDNRQPVRFRSYLP